MKVLPHYLDSQGRHTLSPSLFERDAYQAYLRNHPEERDGIRFDIHWRSQARQEERPLRLQVAIRGSREGLAKPTVLEKELQPRRSGGRWSSVEAPQEVLQKIGRIVAWRVTVWDAERLLAERRSFLWQSPTSGSRGDGEGSESPEAQAADRQGGPYDPSSR